MLSNELRRKFLNYFKNQGATIVPSSPVIPHEDPTLLFTNAGMNQFKDLFLGKSKREYTQAVSSQKCIRVGGKHNDLENVGHTTRHLTFFEMLGNFSFGDYFKKEAIGYAWDVATHIFDLDPEKIWVSVYTDDDEAYALWEKHISPKRIVRFGEAENFWVMGDVGPCGPCSELLYDRGEKYSSALSPKDDPSGERYFEFWNLVFMQFERSADGKLSPLPKQSIDTGSGLERVASLKMGVETVFQTDILRSLIAVTENISGKTYDPENKNLAPAFHVIADHIRSLSFAIADGVQPSNTDRGYVLRKILRRAVRYGRMIGLQRPFLADIFPRLLETMGADFPELKQSEKRIAEILTLEEEAFIRTLVRGGHLLSSVIEVSRAKDRKISGDDAFKLKDTYGFPLEEIQLIAKDEHLTIDLPRFAALEEEAREKSRKAHKSSAEAFESNFFADFVKVHPPCQFVGYTESHCDGKILGLVVENRFTDKIEEGMEAIILLTQTPFYAEMGGQASDTGQLTHGAHCFQVYDTLSPYPGVITHLGKVASGSFSKNETVHATIDIERRLDIQNSHTATHLLHWALQQVLGSHIKQAGSLVEPHRLRFDFSHHKSVSFGELRRIEDLVNEKVRADVPVEIYELSYEEAQKRSDIKQFFGEKYGASVRVVDAAFSKELCGGTHTARTGMIGYFKISKESSISAGVRRIEAATGKYADTMVRKEEDLLQSLATTLKVPNHLVSEKVQTLLASQKELELQLKLFKKKEIHTLAEQFLRHSKEFVGSIHFLAQETALGTEELGWLAEELLLQMKSGVVALASTGEEKCQLLVAVSPDLVQKGLHASALIKEASPCIGGGGGGKNHLAQAGGKNPKGLPLAFQKIKTLLQ